MINLVSVNHAGICLSLAKMANMLIGRFVYLSVIMSHHISRTNELIIMKFDHMKTLDPGSSNFVDGEYRSRN